MARAPKLRLAMLAGLAALLAALLVPGVAPAQSDLFEARMAAHASQKAPA